MQVAKNESIKIFPPITVASILFNFINFFQEAVCIKAFLVHQRPEKFYLHSNIVDLTRYGEHWQELYKGKLDDD